MHKIKDQVRLYLGDESSDLTLYAQAYKQDLDRSWEPSHWQEVFVALQQVQVVYGGDFHPFAQAQRAHLRMIRKLVHERPLTLALECVFAVDQLLVDQFVASQISEASFLEKVGWNSKWGFPWAHYKPLFDFARKHQVPILALNIAVDERSSSTLLKRDAEAAERLVHYMHQDSERLFYVVYGDLHIANSHLPERVRERFGGPRPVESASLYLNSENIYFQLAEAEEESKVEVVKFTDREFCLLSSPPWVKWQSYLMYLEENFDVELEFDDDDEFDEDDWDEWDFQVDHTDNVSGLVKMIAIALDIEVDSNAVEVYSLGDPQALVVTEKVLSPSDKKLAYELIQSDRSFYIPNAGFFYLSKATVNHAATLAGQYVHGVLCGRNSLDWDFPKDFIKFIWIEAMAFMLSKFVNPKRKAQTMADLKKQLEAFDKADRGREPLLLALDQKMIELLSVYANRERQKVFEPRERSSYVLAAKFIGEILGDRYFVLYEKQILGIDSIRQLLDQSLNDKDFESFYFKQLKALDEWELKGP